MVRTAFVLCLLVGGVARAGCPVVVHAAVKAAPVHVAPVYSTGYATAYHAPYVANVVTLAAPLAVVTAYPTAVVAPAQAAAPPAESEELKALRAKVEILERARLEAEIEARVRERLLREAQQNK